MVVEYPPEAEDISAQAGSVVADLVAVALAVATAIFLPCGQLSRL